MKPDARIPIVIGVSGHRELNSCDLAALISSVRAELTSLQARCQHSPLVMLTSLAEGADQLAAQAALDLGIPYIAVLPMEASEYRRDFTGDALRSFDALLAQAESVFVAPDTERRPESPTRDFAYRQAGIYVAMHSHVLIALWDGAPAVSGGCGTAESVDFMLRGSYTPVQGNMLRSEEDGAVIHILTPRKGARGAAGQAAFLGHPAAFHDSLNRTDTFNRHAQAFSGDAHSLVDVDAGDALVHRLNAVYQKADGLSGRSALLYMRVLAILAVSGVIVTLAFLLYDESEMPWMLLLCGLMLLVAGVTYRYSAKTDCHGQYLEYRVLAETLRVQIYLRLAGTDISVATLLTWTQRTETLWIKEAIAALTVAPPPKSGFDVRSCWIEDQRDYHRRAGARAHVQFRANERIMQTALILSVSAYCIALAFEFLSGGAILPVWPQPPETVTLFRTALKLAVGLLSASTLFAANFYGKLSLRRKVSDHEKMVLLYEEALLQWDACDRKETLIRELAREELVENGNWCSYQRDNRPDISL